MSFLLASVIAIGTGSLFLGLAVLLNDQKNNSNKSFALFSLVVVLWISSSYLVDHPIVNNLALFWNRLNFVTAMSMATTIFLFSFEFPKKSYFPNSLKYSYLIGILFFYLIILVTNLGIEDIQFYNWGTNALNGPLFYPGILLSIGNILGFFINIGFRYRRLDENGKLQIKYLFYGFALSIVIGMFTSALLPSITGNYEYAKYAPFGMIFLLGFTAYAILKHHLFDIRVILTETAVLLVILALFIQTLLSGTLMQGLTNGIILLLVTYGGYLLIKSVQHEIKFRQELQVMTEQLAQANAHLKELDAMKTEFVSLASHELLTPVSAIEGYLSMLLDEKMAKVDDPKAADYLNHVYGSSKRLARLVADMLNISRIEEGRLLVEKRDVDLSELIKQVIQEIRFKAEEKRQKIDFVNPDGWATFADPDKIKEVIINIVGNAIKYSKDPGTITIKIDKVPTQVVSSKWQEVEEDIKNRPLDDQEAIKSAVDEHFRNFIGEEQLEIKITDQGIGIPKEELPRLFKKFHRVGDFTTAESQGSGLGLYISRALVEMHHGRIWAESEGHDKGSTFIFSLPDISTKQALLDMEAQAPAKTKEQLKPLARPAKAAEEI